jgi:hypothetical protein
VLLERPERDEILFVALAIRVILEARGVLDVCERDRQYLGRLANRRAQLDRAERVPLVHELGVVGRVEFAEHLGVQQVALVALRTPCPVDLRAQLALRCAARIGG